jgi:uncharacterized Zn-finger protein
MSDLFCNRCAVQFDKKYVFDLHLSLVHGEKIEVKKKTLTICEEKVQEPNISEKEFSNHRVEKHTKCDVCNSIFKTERTLKVHIQSIHESKRPFKCNTCGSSFSQKGNLKGHIASVHDRKKPDKCPICDASFAKTSHLNST